MHSLLKMKTTLHPDYFTGIPIYSFPSTIVHIQSSLIPFITQSYNDNNCMYICLYCVNTKPNRMISRLIRLLLKVHTHNNYIYFSNTAIKPFFHY